ncbi:cytochrome P450 [Aspergillus floccosus]
MSQSLSCLKNDSRPPSTCTLNCHPHYVLCFGVLPPGSVRGSTDSTPGPRDFSVYGLWARGALIFSSFFAGGPSAGHGSGGNFISRHVYAIFDQPLGTQITHWVNSIPNNGLLHFYGLMGAEYLVVTDVESLSDVLSNRSYHFQKTSGLRRYAERFFGRGIVIQEGDEHKKNRKSFVQVFNQRQVDKLKPVLSAKAGQVVQHLSELCSREAGQDEKRYGGSYTASIKVVEFAKLLSFDVMGIIALGIDFNSMQHHNLELFEVFQTLFATDANKQRQFMWHNCAPPWLVSMFPSTIDRQMEKAYRQLRATLGQLIPEMLAALNGKDLSDQDILTQIAGSGSFTQEEIMPQIVTTLAAGYESTASSLSWTLYCLAVNPEIQCALRQEIVEAKLTKNSLDEESYEKLPLLNGVCNEASRLYPTFAMTLRKAICDTYIKGRLVPAGTYIAIVPRAINRSRHLWGPDAEEFIPERWIDRSDPEKPKLNSTGGSSSPICMLSFLYGPRSCVGRSLALAEIRRVTARLVEAFHIQRAGTGVVEPTGFLSSGPPSDLNLLFSPVQK